MASGIQLSNQYGNSSSAALAYLEFVVHTKATTKGTYKFENISLPDGQSATLADDKYLVVNVDDLKSSSDKNIEFFARGISQMPTTPEAMQEQALIEGPVYTELVDKYHINKDEQIVDPNGLGIYDLTWVPDLDGNCATRETLKYLQKTENGLYAIIALQD